MSSFTTPLIITPLSDGRNFKLIEEFDYDVGVLGSGDTIHVPKGFVTDFASIPHVPIALLGLVAVFLGNWLGNIWLSILGACIIFCIVQLPNAGKYGKAAVLHDRIYQTHSRTRREADSIFKEAMLVSGTLPITAFVIWLAVRLFGFWAWRKFNA